MHSIFGTTPRMRDTSRPRPMLPAVTSALGSHQAVTQATDAVALRATRTNPTNRNDRNNGPDRSTASDERRQQHHHMGRVLVHAGHECTGSGPAGIPGSRRWWVAMMDPITQIAVWSTLVQQQALSKLDDDVRTWENVFVSEYPRRRHDA